MIEIKALNTKTNSSETFYTSNTVPLEDFIESLNFIKYGHYRDWKRVKRQVQEINIEVSLSFRHEMKYITTKNEDDHLEIFIFDRSINHDYFYEVIKYIDDQFRKLVSAGFTNGISCYGRSETLNKDSNPDIDITLFTL